MLEILKEKYKGERDEEFIKEVGKFLRGYTEMGIPYHTLHILEKVKQKFPEEKKINIILAVDSYTDLGGGSLFKTNNDFFYKINERKENKENQKKDKLEQVKNKMNELVNELDDVKISEFNNYEDVMEFYKIMETLKKR